MSLDFLVRTLIWCAVLALWLNLQLPAGASLSPRWLGVPTVAGAIVVFAGAALYTWSAFGIAGAKRDGSWYPDTLIVRGPYRFVRNPLYLAIGIIVIGLSLMYGMWHAGPVIRTASLLLAAHVAVVFLEEPGTRRRFGASYDDYARRVPRWLPRWPPRAGAADRRA